MRATPADGGAGRIALTCNGPGEFSGWVRPLAGALYARRPALDLTIFFVPDDYATGREPDVARALFPQARVLDTRAYARFAIGAGGTGVPAHVDLVQYLGGDLMHAARVRERTGARLRTYKFARRRDARRLDRAYAVDEKNAAQLAAAGAPPSAIETIGNLAIDAALAEAAGAATRRIPSGGLLIMPGTRRGEISSLVPFFTQVAVELRRLVPDLPIAFGISPFTPLAELAAALATGGNPLVWGARGAIVELEDGPAILPYGEPPIPLVHESMHHAAHARLVLTIPGTKCIELAALGVPTVVAVPANVPEVAVINGALQYLDRIPLVGIPVKRAAVIAVDRRFALTAQPNIDAGDVLMPELRGTLFPRETARRVAAYAADDAARASATRRLRALYAAHVGAAERMAGSLLAGLPA